VGGWRILQNEEFQKLYASSNIIRVIKSRRVSWIEYVVCVGEMRNLYKILVGKPEGKRALRDLDIDGRIILEWISEK